MTSCSKFVLWRTCYSDTMLWRVAHCPRPEDGLITSGELLHSILLMTTRCTRFGKLSLSYIDEQSVKLIHNLSWKQVWVMEERWMDTTFLLPLTLFHCVNHSFMSNSPPLVQRVTGVRAALQYTGIPTSWLSKRPKLPSRNWLIFLTTTTSILSYYIYDRKQCKAIRQEYVDKVKDLASQPLGTLDLPRKVVVYGARYPGDQDHERCIQYFKKYIKVRIQLLIQPQAIHNLAISLYWSPQQSTMNLCLVNVTEI